MWGNGSSLAIIDVSGSKKASGAKNLADSNRFIKKMCHGGSEWDVLEKKAQKVKNSFRLGFGHLAVTPREIMEARHFKLRDTVCVLQEHVQEGILATKTNPLMYLPLNTQIYESINKRPDAKHILRSLMNKEEQEYRKKQGKEYQLYSIAFRWCKVDKNIISIRNVGKTKAMKRIFFGAENMETVVAGDIAIINAPEINGPQDCSFTTFVKKVYDRQLLPEVEKALGRQKDYRKCLKITKILNLCPYDRDMFTTEWLSTIQEHLQKLNRTIFMRKSGKPIASLNVFSPYRMEQHFREKILRLSTYNVLTTNVLMDVDEWYKNWLTAYRNDLERVKEMDTKPKRHKTIVTDLVHIHYGTLHKKSRRPVPLNWLRRNKLVR